MIPATEVYNDAKDLINPQENGQFTYALFNRWSWVAQLKLMEWLSGDVAGITPPEPYATQKNRDWLSDFTVKYPANVINGTLERPNDYYLFSDLYSLYRETDCGDEEEMEIKKYTIDLLDNSKFNGRANTYIKSLKPNIKRAIAKQVGKEFDFCPDDIGSVVLEYLRYPKKAFIAAKTDETYNVQVPDLDNTVDFEWNEMSRPLLVWFIVDAYANRTRETAIKQNNLLTGKTVREGK